MKKFVIIFIAWLGFIYDMLTDWLRFLFNMKVKPVEEPVEEVTENSDDFSNANFPVVDICGQYHVAPATINGKLNTPKTPWEDFKNKIKWFPTEQEAFDEWKEKYYPDATANTVEKYRKEWKKFKYQIWGCRVLNVKSLPHDPNFPVMYCIVDVEREVEGNRLQDDIRHWYIDFVKANYNADDIEHANEEHKVLAKKPDVNWGENVNATRQTIK